MLVAELIQDMLGIVVLVDLDFLGEFVGDVDVDVEDYRAAGKWGCGLFLFEALPHTQDLFGVGFGGLGWA